MGDTCMRCGYDIVKEQCDCSSGRPLRDDGHPEAELIKAVARSIAQGNPELVDTSKQDDDDIYDQWVDMNMEDKERGL